MDNATAELRSTRDHLESTAHPAPEVPCRTATEEEIPRAAKTLRRQAEQAGWQVRATYARGTWPGPKPRLIESLALRMVHPDGRRAVAVWHDGRWRFGLSNVTGVRKLSAAEVKEVVRGAADLD